ncbi:hypothetical protein OG765_31985 [Streptomyces sp. NBC_00555]|uniref:hypothetical protein n=1 Tax=Streptomyces sp. NBC_00555 TaxID=2903662 RepID=UPI002259E8C7|nr:hypothetical protein [Streptomyces sp. NBC_00555]MCX5015543.1 hypothetical protein [Streptomyces sp. NBC_00555]
MAREYGDFCHRLGDAGRRAVLAAGVPEDPAELWERAGMTAAAERMAAVWAELLGTTPYVDEELAGALEADLGLGDGWARALAAGRASAQAQIPGGAGFVLVGSRSGGLALHHAEADGSAGRRLSVGRPFHAEPASVVAWALTERPAGDPAAQGAAALYDALRARLDDPGTLIPLCWNSTLGRAAAEDPAFVPYEGTVLPCPEPPYREDTEPSVAYDDGLFVVAVPGRDVFLRPAALADPQRVDRAVRLCGELGLPGVLEAVRRIQAVCGEGLRPDGRPRVLDPRAVGRVRAESGAERSAAGRRGGGRPRGRCGRRRPPPPAAVPGPAHRPQRAPLERLDTRPPQGGPGGTRGGGRDHHRQAGPRGTDGLRPG